VGGFLQCAQHQPLSYNSLPPTIKRVGGEVPQGAEGHPEPRAAVAADWHDHLPWVMLGVRMTFRKDSDFSAEAVFG
jgi:hypothetical protein